MTDTAGAGEADILARAPRGGSAGGGLRRRRPARADRTFQTLALVAGLAVVGVLAGIALSTSDSALPALRHAGATFFASSVWDLNVNHFGALAYIYGTLVTSGLALIIAVPASLGIALVLSEVAPQRTRRPLIYAVDLLAAIPSVVFGLWGLLVLAPVLGHVFVVVSRATRPIPVLSTLLSGGTSGVSVFTAGLVVALMVTPIITSLSREVFATVPAAQKEAALALGCTRWEMIRHAVLPYGRGGVVGAIMLGLGRAMGETIAVVLLVGSSPRITARLFASGDTMAATIANQFGESSGLGRSAYLGLGVLLFVITIVVNSGARAVLTRAEQRLGTAL